MPVLPALLMAGATIGSTLVASNASSKAAAQQAAIAQQQVQAQQTATGRAAERDAVQIAEQDSPAARVSRAFGRRMLAFNGQTGVSDLGSSTSSSSPALSPTLGG